MFAGVATIACRLLTFGWIFSLVHANVILPACGVPVIYKMGYPDWSASVYNCSAQIPSPFNAPSYFINHSAVEVSYQFVLNDLIQVDDLTQTIRFDTKFRMQWYDNRWNVPQFFEVLNPNETANGIEIDLLVNDYAFPLPIWRPNVHFIDAQDVAEIAETVRIKENGKVYWSRHLILTVTQEFMNFQKYPMDTQKFGIRFEPYSLPSNMLKLVGSPSSVTLYNDNGLYPFEHNAMWSYLSSSSDVIEVNRGTSTKPRYFSTGTLYINMARQSAGLVFRLAVPIVFILILAGFIFWADPEERVGSTITLLLAISALYIVIFGSIPMLGYLTVFDEFCLMMYAMIFLCCLLHQVGVRMVQKIGGHSGEHLTHHPIRKLYVRGSEFVGRVTVIPLVLFTFFGLFGNAYDYWFIVLSYCLTSAFGVFVLSRELPGMLKIFVSTLAEIRDMAFTQPHLMVTSEIVLMNLYFHGIFSRTLEEFNRRRNDSDADAAAEEAKKNVAAREAEELEMTQMRNLQRATSRKSSLM
jgi:hypothetical protein